MFAELSPSAREAWCGMPHTPFRMVLNTLLNVLITGCVRSGFSLRRAFAWEMTEVQTEPSA